MTNLEMLLGVRVESKPGVMRELVVFRPRASWEWRAGLPALLDLRPAPPMLVQYVVRLFQRQQPSVAAGVGLLGLSTIIHMALEKANEQVNDWDLAQIVE